MSCSTCLGRRRGCPECDDAADPEEDRRIRLDAGRESIDALETDCESKGTRSGREARELIMAPLWWDSSRRINR
ncbi:MAG: hypothetical protein FD160_3769 [Caulobacteraceae bacterium]|nr:MAG: hypothetical protein FD160_3769 [Caulobacteraceae bacterium]